MREQTENKPNLSSLFADLSLKMAEHAKRYVIGEAIKWPLEVKGVVFKGVMHSGGRRTECAIGSLVMVRLCGENKETHLGIYLGDFPVEIFHQYDKETGNLEVFPDLNPAMLVPKLKRIVWGCESWWSPIQNETDLRQITDKDIQDVWYVKLLKEMEEAKK